MITRGGMRRHSILDTITGLLMAIMTRVSSITPISPSFTGDNLNSLIISQYHWIPLDLEYNCGNPIWNVIVEAEAPRRTL